MSARTIMAFTPIDMASTESGILGANGKPVIDRNKLDKAIRDAIAKSEAKMIERIAKLHATGWNEDGAPDIAVESRTIIVRQRMTRE